MTPFDDIAILDWSAARGPRKGPDSIWLGLASATGVGTENLATRALAEQRLRHLVAAALAGGRRLLIGADFAFGFPQGFAQAIAGRAHAFAMWEWLAAQVIEAPGNVTNYRRVAARMNSVFPSEGPFWGNGEAVETPGLPRRKPPLPAGLPAVRHCDQMARSDGQSPKTVWQLAGAGAVGAQVLTGLPVLHRLRQAFAGQLSVWPFEQPSAPVILAEVYPSLLGQLVAQASSQGTCKDEVQVRLLAAAFWQLSCRPDRTGLTGLFTPAAPADVLAEEGWMLGAGQADILRAALDEFSGTERIFQAG